jgi:phosphoglycolate phosphatase-like HAD superfamily hydrolase
MKIVLFDWNGTILDDAPIWYESVKEIFRVYKKQAPTIAEYFRELEGDYLGIYQSRDITASRDELNAIYEPHYNAHVQKAELFFGVRKVLKTLAARGVIVGIITMQKDFLVLPLLIKFGINNYFNYLEFNTFDKKAAIQKILAKESVDPQECCYIGDAPSDIRHGKKAGVKTAAFLSGYIPEDLLLKAEPEFTVRNFAEILQVI